MFAKLRQKDIKKILWVLVIVIVPAFIFWGASGFLGRERDIAGTVYEEKISFDDFRTLLKNLQLYLLFESGQEYQADDLQMLAWQTLLLSKKAEREGIEVSDRQTIQKIKNFPALNIKGGFSKERYLRILSRTKISPSQFENFLKDQIKAEKLQDKIIGQVDVTQKEIKELYKAEHEEAKIKYINISFDKIKKEITPQPGQLEDFFKNNKREFKKPAKVKIAYILIEEPGQKIINSMAKKAKKANSLTALSKDSGLEVITSDFLTIETPIKGLGWQKEIIEKAFEMEKSQVAGPVATSEGSVFFQKLEEQKSYIPEYSEIKMEVKEKYAEAKSRQKAKELAQDILVKIKEKNIADLSGVKKFFPPIELKETDFFKRQGYIEGIGLKPALTHKVFELKENRIIPEPIPLKKGIYFVQRTELKPIDEDKFSEEKEKYRKAVRKAKQTQYFNSYILKLIEESNFSISPKLISENKR